jgi:mRNA-degrading endonuclease RelE of RelBE toxin-antitoxin system
VALIIPPRVAIQLARLPRRDAQRLREKLDRIAEEPHASHSGVLPMTGLPGRYRVRQGDWRAIYVIKDGHVIVGTVANRKEIYR